MRALRKLGNTALHNRQGRIEASRFGGVYLSQTVDSDSQYAYHHPYGF